MSISVFWIDTLGTIFLFVVSPYHRNNDVVHLCPPIDQLIIVSGDGFIEASRRTKNPANYLFMGLYYRAQIRSKVSRTRQHPLSERLQSPIMSIYRGPTKTRQPFGLGKMFNAWNSCAI